MSSLENYVVEGIPRSIYYIPDFISADEEAYLMKQVNSAPKPKWTQLLNRRLQNWGGLPHPKGMIPEKLPKWLEVYAQKLAGLGVFEDKIPNHVLVNEYLPGQGIMPHLDGPLYYPTVSTISLGSHTLLNFYRPLSEGQPAEGATELPVPCALEQDSATSSSSFEDRNITSILLEPRSLILVKDDMYNLYLHGIDEEKTDTVSDKVANIKSCSAQLGDKLERSTRVSLTIRHVPKVLKSKILLGRR